MEQDTIRARSIELVNERGERGLVLDGGGGDKEPGLVVYGPGVRHPRHLDGRGAALAGILGA